MIRKKVAGLIFLLKLIVKRPLKTPEEISSLSTNLSRQRERKHKNIVPHPL